MTDIPFIKDFKFGYGEPSQLSPLVRRVIASIALTALVSAPVISCGPAQKPTGGGATTGGTTTPTAGSPMNTVPHGRSLRRFPVLPCRPPAAGRRG